MCRKLFPALCALVCLAPLSLVAQQANAPPTGLHVLSATLNPITHQVDVQLHNSTPNKTVTAYVLHIKGFDADGREIQDDGIGLDYIDADNPNNVNTRGYILAGRTARELVAADPRALTVEVSVMGVVYLDRTYEGGRQQGRPLTRAGSTPWRRAKPWPC